MTELSPVASIVGGVMIGTAAGLLWRFTGRIAGVSGVVSGLVDGRHARGDRAWRVAFVGGLLLGGLLLGQVLPDAFEVAPAGTWPVLVAAGLLVGFGTRLGSGCTSGHGVCGLSRLSKRSLVATATFMATGFLTVYVVRHGLG
jgi:uncharacterized membrane protein YedE/YeeE